MSSTQHALALAFLQSFEDLDAKANIALRTPECRHEFAPASLNFPPSMTNVQWAAHVESLTPLLETFSVYLKEIFAHGHQITIWATSSANFGEEVKEDAGVDWSYHGKYIFILCLNQTGDSIERVVEFLDSQRVVEVRVLMDRARQNLRDRK